MDKGFKELQAKWYEKLKESGFDDIEVNPQLHSQHFRHKANDNFKSEYYERANIFLEDYDFDTPDEAIIWRYHCIGKSIRVIARELKLSKSHVGRVVKELKTIMLGAIL